MINIAKASTAERRVLFTNTGDKTGIHPAIVEKDFWVCYVLDYLFHRSEWKEALVFKGGTSLSKAFHIIKRFSEDIDLILEIQEILKQIKHYRFIKVRSHISTNLEKTYKEFTKYNRINMNYTDYLVLIRFNELCDENIRKAINFKRKSIAMKGGKWFV